MTKEYLGDAVYVSVENGMLRLTTENGYEATNEIYLERPVFLALVGYVARVDAEIAAQTVAKTPPAEEVADGADSDPVPKGGVD